MKSAQGFRGAPEQPIFLRKGQENPQGFVSVPILTHAQLIQRLELERARDVSPAGMT